MKYFDRFHPSNYYHVYNHAVGNEDLFRTPANFLYFLLRFKKYMDPVLIIHGYCLMPNHFHFLVQIRNREIINQLAGIETDEEFDAHKFIMQKLSNCLNSYAKSYNKYFSRRGALFIDYTKRIEMQSDFSLMKLLKYIHMNPVRHGFCQSMSEWKYSSYTSFLDPGLYPSPEMDFIFEYFDSLESFVNFHKQV
jgi:putative transposase